MPACTHSIIIKIPFDEQRKRESNFHPNSMEIALIGIENNLSARRNYYKNRSFYNKFVQEQMEQQIAKVQTANQKKNNKTTRKNHLIIIILQNNDIKVI